MTYDLKLNIIPGSKIQLKNTLNNKCVTSI